MHRNKNWRALRLLRIEQDSQISDWNSRQIFPERTDIVCANYMLI